jgi:DNA-binding transcriptional ArsR family regulator
MNQNDDFSDYYRDLLEGRYDCPDRVVLTGYFPLGQQGGGFRYWWQKLTGSEATLDQEHLLRMAGRFSRRVHAYAKRHRIRLIHCEPGIRKHELAEQYRPADPTFTGLFLILVAKAPALVWEVTTRQRGGPHLARKTPWPYVNHYHFHVIDQEWGHLTFKMSGHPPFGVQVILNGHEWVERRARKRTISAVKEGNCFVGGSDFPALDRLADTLCDDRAIGRLTKVCDRWVYSTCLGFALPRDEQRRSGFRYQYSCFQLEYSRNLLFTRGTVLEEVYQGLIDRTRRVLNVDTLKTIFGRKRRPHHLRTAGHAAPRLERVLDPSAYDLTVFKVHFGRLTLKIYDKGARVLRIEVIVHSVKALQCGKSLEKLSIVLARLQRMVIDFLNVVHAAHLSTLDAEALDALPQPTHRGAQRLAGVDIQQPRMRAVIEAVLTLAPKPGGFTAGDLAAKTGVRLRKLSYAPRHAAYDLRKLRGKGLVERAGRTRRYRPTIPAVRTLAGLLILREKVIKPVLAGAGQRKPGRPPKWIHPLDVHYDNLQRELRRTFQTLGLAA